MQHREPPSPWREFFEALAAGLAEPVELHCLGGFVVSMLYGMPRPTADVDYLDVTPVGQSGILQELGGAGSALHRRHGVYLQQVGVTTVPEDYLTRMIPMFPNQWGKVRLLGLDAHDLALSKLERNDRRDREDVRFLARAGRISVTELERRYRQEMRPYLALAERHDLTMRLWVEMLGE